MKLILGYKHLPGSHDQSTHTPKGYMPFEDSTQKPSYEFTTEENGKYIIAHNQFGIGTIIANRNGDTTAAIETMDMLKDILSTVPEKDVMGLKKLDSNAGNLWSVASYISGNDAIWLTNKFWQKPEADHKPAILEEVGHRVQHKDSRLFGKFPRSNTKHFKALIGESGKNYAKDHQLGEVFARSYSMYYTQPKALKSSYPDLYQFWQTQRG